METISLVEYALKTVLTTLGLSDLYLPYLEENKSILELITKYLKGELLEHTSKNPLQPKVNLLIDEIERNLINKLPKNLPYIKKWYWPHWKEYALCLSHDVDKLGESRKHIWKVRQRFSKMTVLKALLGLKNPYNNFKLFVELEKKRGVRSTFYLLINEYDLNKIYREISLLKESNMELGLHGGFGSHTNIDQLLAEKEKLEQFLGQEIHGIRQHFLKFEFPTTWIVQKNVQLGYDTTIGFNDNIGFKLGFCFPFFPPDQNLEPLCFIELPLIIMDAAIWTWLKLTEQTALQTISQIRDIIKQYHGLLTILWHQCTLQMRGGRIYRDILEKIVEDDAYIGSGREIAEWWKARNKFQIKIEQSINDIIIHCENPSGIEWLGIEILIDKNYEYYSCSSNLALISTMKNKYRFTFSEGLEGQIHFKKLRT